MSTPHDAERSTDEAVSGSTEAADNAAILRALATSVALLPQVPQPEGQEPPEGAIALPVIEQDGQRFIPVFTSEDSLRAAWGRCLDRGSHPDRTTGSQLAEGGRVARGEPGQ